MSYTALYRKYRPDTFEDVKGQDAIVTTLRNQVLADRVSHAYLFCGTRGTGKTTVAKIFAKAVNCTSPVAGSPCGSCALCKSMAGSSSVNLIEVDAASNNGVDFIRQIKEEVFYPPATGRYKVYIIDEVHMLSASAFNALLKTLEEPPAYVIFILATTEAHKLPITILSRCQRYDFKRITATTIHARLAALMQEEEIDVEDAALQYVARAADGSMRDALSLLDQCIAFHMGQRLTYDHVLDILGAVDTAVFARLLSTLQKRDAAAALTVLEELVAKGRELSWFVNDFTWYLRNLLLVQTADNMEEILDMTTENVARLKEQSALAEPEELLHFIRTFAALSEQLRLAVQKRVLVEIAIIKLCCPEMESSTDALAARMKKLEAALEKVDRRVREGVVARPERGPAPVAAAPKEVAPPPLPPAIPAQVEQVVKEWKSILQQLGGRAKSNWNKAYLSLGGGNKLLLVFDAEDISYAYAAEEAHQAELKSAIAGRIGKEVALEIQKNETGQRTSDVYPNLEALIHMEIEVED